MKVSFTNISKRYDAGPPAVDDVSFVAESGELVVLLGESGCGKTTTLKLINRLFEPTSGRIFFDGVATDSIDSVELRRSVGYVFQGVGLFPHLSIAENIAITPRLLGWTPENIANRVDALLDMVKLSPEQFRGRYPHELSGGQQQRVGFARALAAKPKVMLLDEPFGALDPLTRDSLRDDFRLIHNQLALTSLLVTHDVTEALLLADRIIIMHKGKIVQNDNPKQLLRRPFNEYVEQLLDTPKRQNARMDTLMLQGTRHEP